MTSVDIRVGLPLKDRIIDVSGETIRDFKTRSIHPLENNKIYDFLEGLPKAAKYAVLQRVSRVERINKVKRSLGEAFTVCLFHPGVNARLKDFIAFCTEQKRTEENLSPTDALTKFSAHLGEITLYRGMALTNNESTAIQQQGIMAQTLRDDQTAVQALAILLDPSTQIFDRESPYPTSFSDDITFRTIRSDKLNQTISISTSIHHEVASSVGWYTSEKKDTPEVSPYLCTLRVPRLLTYDEIQLIGDSRSFETFVIGDKTFGIEQREIFLPFGVAQRHITQVEKTPIPPIWKGKFEA